jgi:hypothetical protein
LSGPRRLVGGVAVLVLAPVAVGVSLHLIQNGSGSLCRIAGGPPLQVRAQLMDDLTAAGSVALRDPITSVQDRAVLFSGSHDELISLIRRHHGVRAGNLAVAITLQGTCGNVTVTDIRVHERIPRGTPVPTGALLIQETQGGRPAIGVTCNLDTADQTFMVTGKPGQRYFGPNQVHLAPSEQVVVYVQFKASRAYHEFDLFATYFQNGITRQVDIPGPDGGVFRLTGLARDRRAYQSIYEAGLNGGYVPVAP